MSNMKDGGQAFPRIDGIEPFASGAYSVICSNGMTLRDYFAAKAMNGVLSSVCGTMEVNYKDLATIAYAQADAMLAKRALEGQEEV